MCKAVSYCAIAHQTLPMRTGAKPHDRHLRGGFCFLGRFEYPGGIMTDWEPSPPIFGIAAELFESKTAIRALKDINTQQVTRRIYGFYDFIFMSHFSLFLDVEKAA
ncbi:hypothetical protein [Oceaniglobus ichthyenteri]|uniref:hypothetical protein n=1 Tax=Oceaniglobus ichthyenteri TaxID=2136177 RepID=UPI0013DD8B25|nr:hypothetical protein [Oceaniglobus ichthyenteri]